MNYFDFFSKLKQADSRVEFTITSGKCKLNKYKIPDYYQEIDPYNVEFEFNDGIVRLVPLGELEEINRLYSIKNGVVFATCNGEPIYEKEGEVYTCIFSKKGIIEEKIASSIVAMFEEILASL